MEDKTEEVIEIVQKNAQTDDERKWCVYCHTNKINNKKYFGITSQKPENRWNYGRGYQGQDVFWNAINKYTWDGFDHEVLFKNLTKKEAEKKEIELIALYKTNCFKYYNPSYGYNGNDGGNGFHTVTKEMKEKMSNAAKNRFSNPENIPWKGKTLSEETKKRISASSMGKKISDKAKKKMSDAKKDLYKNPENHPNYGKHLSKEAKERLSILRCGTQMGINNGRYKPVYCIQLNEILWGQQEAKNKYNINRGSVGSCCRGEQSYAGKHPITKEKLIWKYVDDYISKDGTIIQGAITLGYITEEQVNEYLNSLKQKGNDT